MRIGQGFDVHAFGPGTHVVLGGVTIAHTHGLVAHSDGDVVIHALCDAVIGALALGDIGRHFSPNDARWKDVSSRHFLLQCAGLMIENGYVLANADVTVICEQPKIGPHAEAMRESLAADLGCAKRRSTSKYHHRDSGFTGRGEGIGCIGRGPPRTSQPVATVTSDNRICGLSWSAWIWIPSVMDLAYAHAVRRCADACA